MHRPTRMVFVAAVAFGALLAPVLAHAADDVSVVLTAQRVAVVDGKEQLMPAEQAQPGDVIEYRAEYRNASAEPIGRLAATLPVPRGMEYLPTTAMPEKLLASLDGKAFEPVPLKRRVRLANGREVVRDVQPAEYRFLRWSLGTLDAGQSRVVAARVRVSPLLVSAATP